jgi:hypothetical protein
VERPRQNLRQQPWTEFFNPGHQLLEFARHTWRHTCVLSGAGRALLYSGGDPHATNAANIAAACVAALSLAVVFTQRLRP